MTDTPPPALAATRVDDAGTLPRSALSRLGGRMSRDTLVYAVGMAMVFPFSLVQVAVLTRYLSPAEYGDLSLLLIASTVITIFMSLGVLQGTLRHTYGYGGDDGDDGIDLDDADGDLGDVPGDIAQTVRDKQTALTTGVLLISAISVVVAIPVIAGSPWIAQILLHDRNAAGLVVWAGVAAMIAAIFRLTLNVLRMERRPYQFVAISAIRPTLVVALAALLVIEGFGVKGVLMATAAGTAIAAALSVAFARRNYRFAFRADVAKEIYRRGRGYTLFMLALFLFHNLDTLLLSRWAPTAEVGVYRVASRIASVPSYFVSAFLLAQVPLMRSTLMLATDEELGQRRTRSLMLTYFVVAALTIVLAISLTADLLVQIAAPSYAAAADLVPILSVSFMAYGVFMVVFRSVRGGSRWIRAGLLFASLALMVVLAPLLIPPLGGYGAALCALIAMSAATLFVLWKASKGDDPFEPQTARMVKAALLAAACWLIATRMPIHGDAVSVAVDVLVFVAFLVLLVVFNAIPRDHVKVLRDVGVAGWRDMAGRHPIHSRLEDVPARRRVVVEAVVLARNSPAEIAAREGISEEELQIRLVRGLRPLAGHAATKGSHRDAEIGAYLLAPQSAAIRDGLARRLVRDGADPVELDDLVTALRALQRRRSPRVVGASPRDESSGRIGAEVQRGRSITTPEQPR